MGTYKEWNIKIRYVNGKLGTIVNLNFDEEVYDILALVGELENLKQQQLEKLKNSGRVVKRSENPDE